MPLYLNRVPANGKLIQENSSTTHFRVRISNYRWIWQVQHLLDVVIESGCDTPIVLSSSSHLKLTECTFAHLHVVTFTSTNRICNGNFRKKYDLDSFALRQDGGKDHVSSPIFLSEYNTNAGVNLPLLSEG